MAREHWTSFIQQPSANEAGRMTLVLERYAKSGRSPSDAADALAEIMDELRPHVGFHNPVINEIRSLRDEVHRLAKQPAQSVVITFDNGGIKIAKAEV